VESPQGSNTALKAAKNSVLSSQSADSQGRRKKQSATISTQTDLERDEAEIFRLKEKLASYCREMRNVLNDQRTKEKLSATEVKTVEESYQAGIDFINQASLKTTTADIWQKQADLETKFDPIVQRVQQADKNALEEYCR
jgi:dimeric dUTPase (all-alpha-NTP-PPase superfamily)